MARVKREPYTVEEPALSLPKGPHACMQLRRPLKEFSHNLKRLSCQVYFGGYYANTQLSLTRKFASEQSAIAIPLASR
jgi:hypothetical protein